MSRFVETVKNSQLKKWMLGVEEKLEKLEKEVRKLRDSLDYLLEIDETEDEEIEL